MFYNFFPAARVSDRFVVPRRARHDRGGDFELVGRRTTKAGRNQTAQSLSAQTGSLVSKLFKTIICYFTTGFVFKLTADCNVVEWKLIEKSSEL